MAKNLIQMMAANQYCIRMITGKPRQANSISNGAKWGKNCKTNTLQYSVGNVSYRVTQFNGHIVLYDYESCL